MENGSARPPAVTPARLQAAVAACRKAGAELVYLFGSQARGKAWSQSDVDLAVLLGSSLAKERHGQIRIQLIAELMSIFRSNNIDVVVLNDAPPLLTYEGVIRRGRLLFEKDRLARIRFEVRAFQEYVDTAPLREVQNRYLKEAIQARAATLPREDGKQGHTW
jgi:predicted nucleotidyltransferase